MINTDKYKGHTPAPWDYLVCATTGKKWVIDGSEDSAWNSIALVDGVGENDVGWNNMMLMADAPLLLEEVKRLRKALHIEEQIVQAFYEYREACCFDHCEAWMLENGHRVMVKIDDDEQSEWKVEVE